MEENNTNVEANTETNKPSTEDLMARIAEAETRAKEAEERAKEAEEASKKYKGANDKLSKENAEHKRKERQSMSEEGQKLADAEERALKAEERLAELEKEMSRTKGLATYNSLSEDTKAVENFYDAVFDNDHDYIMKFITDYGNAIKEQTRKEVTAEIQKNYPQTNVGANGSDGKSKAEKLVEKTRNNKPQNSNSILSHYI